MDKRHAVDGPTKLLSPEDLAARFGVPVTTVYQWNSRSYGPRRLSIGRHVRYRLSDVIAWENTRYADEARA